MAPPVPCIHGDYNRLKGKALEYVEESVALCKPDDIWLCDGSPAEFSAIVQKMREEGQIRDLPKYKNCFIVQTDPSDVARVENKTVIVTKKKEEAVPLTKEGVAGELGIWMSPEDWEKAFQERWPGCMKGRTMYIMPFSMGPIGGPLSKIGIELTDSKYVVLCMIIMTRLGQNVLEVLGTGQFVKCLHSVGQPLPSERKILANWPCNPEKVLVAHFPDTYEIRSFGSGYGGNSLLGKKCFSLRIGMCLARDEGWLAEHMLISRIEMPNGKFKYITAAFPSACGKTNLAMMTPTIPGYKVTTIGDDICWMRFDDQGQLRAINPENGFFGVCPGTSEESNPMAMATIFSNTVFTNTATTSDGGVWWEGMPLPEPGVTITDWRGNPWDPKTSKTPAAQPNSRFTTPAGQCPIIDPDWENPKGVPVDAVIFGGRRPEGVPLIYESFTWQHGVFIGACARSETTSAQQDSTVKVVRNDPFAMKPFFGYNFGKYLKHWLSFAQKPGLKLPKIFHVNWFRKDANGKFLWPGYGDNSRAIDWLCRRLNNEDCAVETPIGYIPKLDAVNVTGLNPAPDMKQLLSLPKEFWLKESEALKKFLEDQVPFDMPEEIRKEADGLIARCKAMP